MKRKGLNIGVISVGRSENLGDAVISKSIELSLLEVDNNTNVSFFDLDYGEYSLEESLEPKENTKISSFKKRTYYPRAFYNLFRVLTDANFKNKLESFVHDKDLILIGGGHLLIDNYCYFSAKLYLVANLCLKLKVRYEIWCVGVSKTHSLLSKTLLKSVLNYKIVYTRDTNSTLHIKSIMGGKVKVKSLMDPAIFIGKFQAIKPIKKYDVAIGIMDPGEMVRHSGVYVTREDFALKYINLINKLLENKMNILIFTNGNNNDFLFSKNYIYEKIILKDNLHFAKKPVNYGDIIVSLNSSNIVFAQRLHALLPALVMNKSVIGLEWDNKLKSIFSDLGTSSSLLKPNFCYENIYEIIINENNKVNKSYNKIDEFRALYLECLEEVLNG
ncbi:polysaccharide pyruvyl transferase family protein [Pseudoalteromonas sp. SCQQ13]|uniref:polysaccharide pyruvyl transferase family protein n=1 Tax=Pseudoalteromonas sp. SCQQ13 TaxID=2792066 RepID=UPI0018CE78B1|nr:polysaccharide pyruvyl transferase family protein [Pseudoalteromonas sp. SCQQ13]MBH0093517.1 polysaccharide pyruvyl transferase family protein [Pseudoalteromonas sp. SCQQ13]